jgi:prevent-host-death family protein
MLVASISEAKNKLSALLDRVRNGETILIVDRGKPVARLEPAVSAAEDTDSKLSRLERAGIAERGTGTAHPDIFRKKPPRPLKGGSVLEALLEERREAR